MDIVAKDTDGSGSVGRTVRSALLSFQRWRERGALPPMSRSRRNTKWMVFGLIGAMVEDSSMRLYALRQDRAVLLGVLAGFMAVQVIPPRYRWSRFLCIVVGTILLSVAWHSIWTWMKGR